MFSNILAAALRNLARNRIYAGISILGLTLGMTAVILTGLYISSELSFDRFFPDYQKAYVVTSTLRSPGQSDIAMDYTPPQVAEWLKLEVPQVKDVARMYFAKATARHGDFEAIEDIAWVDPAFFSILRLPALTGDPAQAIAAPDNVIITRAMARKYFGRADPLGMPLQLDGHDLRVGAVLEDFPPETHLTQGIFGSARYSYSLPARQTAMGIPQPFLNFIVTPQPGKTPDWKFEKVRARVYLRIDGPEDAEIVSDALPGFSERHAPQFGLPPKAVAGFDLTPLAKFHTYGFKGANLGATDQRGSLAALYALGAIAGLVLLLAVFNFVNLTTARAARRAVEVGVRKAGGAQRSQLVVQFLGEAFLQALLAMIGAMILVELLLPSLNAFLLRGMVFPYWRDPLLAALLLGGVVIVGLLGGAYPAFVLSSFRPAQVLKGLIVPASGSIFLRQASVIFQFAVLVVLILAVAVFWKQTAFAMDEGLRVNKDQVLVVYATPCRGALTDEIQRLPGVKAVACSSRAQMGLHDFSPIGFDAEPSVPGGSKAAMTIGLVDFGFFELFDVRPVAGRLFDRARPADESRPAAPRTIKRGAVVLNEAAALRLGFAQPADAVGSQINFTPEWQGEVIGVVPDFSLDVVSAAVKPTAFVIDFAEYPEEQVLSVKLADDRIPETLTSIDGVWKRTGQTGVIRREFLDEYIQRLNAGTVRQAGLVTALGVVALLLASLGLLGLAAFTAERRTKEIGIRKAMGASVGDVLRLLLWQFTKPVVAAIAIALPVGYLLLSRWLERFSYRIELSPDLFLLSALAALVIAWLTVLTHALAVAHAKPISALRYE